MSHNRFVFATSFAILAMMAIGLDVLWQGECSGGVVLGAVGRAGRAAALVRLSDRRPAGAARHRTDRPPYARRTAAAGSPIWPACGRYKPRSFARTAVAGVLCGLGLAGWLVLWLRVKWRRWFLPLLATLLLADLLWFAYGRPAQCDPALYYPRIPALEEVAKAEPGRIIGFNCLPAMLGQSHNLRDVRGYDAVDPLRMVELLKIAADPRARQSAVRR